MSKKRVVITGMGLISPLGHDVETAWSSVVSGKSGVGPIDRFSVEEYPTKIAATVRDFDITTLMDAKEARKVDEFVHYAVAAAGQAVRDAELAITDENRSRIGVSIGSGIGGLPFITNNHEKLLQSGPRRVSPFFIPGTIINMASGVVSIQHGVTGPNLSVVTACTTGSHNIAMGVRLIQSGDADVMLAGGSEMTTNPMGLAGFSAVRALSTRNDEPEKASRPWDQDRDGFIMGEGAGVLVLESYEHANARGAKIYGELLGLGMSGDAYHITSPGGGGALAAMRNALADAQLQPEQIDYINAHATSTSLGDRVEAEAIAEVFANHLSELSVSSTKSMTGHLIGAAGAVEAIFTLLALRDQVAPPTINLDQLDPECDLGIDFVPNEAKPRKIHYALSNSFGFGGSNASLIFSSV